MKKTISIFTFVFVFLALSTIVPAQKVKDTSVTSTIEDYAPNGSPFSIQSDANVLDAYKNGSDSVISRIQAIGDWELNMLGSANRRVFINFSDPVNPLDPANGAPANNFYPVRFLAQCPADLRNLASGASQNCKMVVAVDVGADRYSIRFGYVAETTQPLWTCQAATSGKCANWRMASDPNGTGRNAAQLYKITTSKGKNVETPLGKYYFSFGINVSNP